MPRRPHARPQHQSHHCPDGHHHRDLVRLLARLIAARWRQIHAAPRITRPRPRKGFTRHK